MGGFSVKQGGFSVMGGFPNDGWSECLSDLIRTPVSPGY